jgi:two-component system nitrate/nitrite sensor histidine kinase NarX
MVFFTERPGARKLLVPLTITCLGGERMLQLLLRTFLAERRPRGVPAVPAYRQALAALPLRLLQQGGADAPVLELLPQLQRALDAAALNLWLPQQGLPGWRYLGTPAALEAGDCPGHGDELPLPGAVKLCAGCLSQGRYRALAGLYQEQGHSAVLQVDFARRPQLWQRDRLREMARPLAEALQAFAEERRLRRRELSAERGVLARELHDSVAQQLSYLQIRASRLQAVLEQREHAAADVMLDDLREGLRVMHRQVRELISSARLTMDGHSLRQALEASVEAFSRSNGCVFSLDNRLPAHSLPSEVELQVLQIVREALANVVRHSHARQVSIRLWPQGSGVVVEVHDDGVGLPPMPPEEGHFGLNIMRERAASIGAQLAIESSPGKGTCVRLQWGRT